VVIADARSQPRAVLRRGGLQPQPGRPDVAPAVPQALVRLAPT
jgi:hypothetical protein